MTSRVLLASVLFLAIGAARADDGFAVGVGADYSSGDYGTDITTTIWNVPVVGRYTSGNWTWKGVLPWLSVQGDPTVIPGLGNVGTVNPAGRTRGNSGGATTPVTTTSSSASGIGDLRFAGTYSFDTGTALGVDLSGNIKIATADEDKGLGTGANDYGLALDLYGKVGETTLFGGTGYTRLGESDFIDTNNVFNAGFGAMWAAGVGNLGLSYDWRSAASDTADDRSEVTAFYSIPASEDLKWQLYATKGLSDGSPEWGLGASMTYTF
jgi:hypothetical protein